jgi:hypothetical protein
VGSAWRLIRLRLGLSLRTCDKYGPAKNEKSCFGPKGGALSALFHPQFSVLLAFLKIAIYQWPRSQTLENAQAHKQGCESQQLS